MLLENPQIREQMSGPDLHVVTLKTVFFPIKDTSQNCFDFVYLYFVQLFSADPKYFQKNSRLIFCP